jgi:hypothetical protein
MRQSDLRLYTKNERQSASAGRMSERSRVTLAPISCIRASPWPVYCQTAQPRRDSRNDRRSCAPSGQTFPHRARCSARPGSPMSSGLRDVQRNNAAILGYQPMHHVEDVFPHGSAALIELTGPFR